MAILSSGRNGKQIELVDGKQVLRWKKSWAFVAFFPIFYTAVFTIPRSDTYLYLASYNSLPSTFSKLISNFNLSESANLFKEIVILIRCIFGTNQIWFRIFMGLFHTIPVVLIFRKYSEDYLFTLYIFAAIGCHQGWMMNGIRQFLAVVLIFSTTPWMIEKKYIKVLIVILIASRIHTSALVMLPLIFVVSGKAWNKRTLLYLLASIIAMVVFSVAAGAMDSLLVGTEYAGTEANMRAYGDDGMNPIRALVYSVPTIIAFLGRKRIQAEDDKVLNLCVNMSIATAGISFIATATSGIMIGRLPIYTNMYSFVMLPELLNKIFGKNNAKAVTAIAVVLYFAFYVYECGGF